MWLYFLKPIIYAQELKSIFCLFMIDTIMHYPETPSARQQIARSAFTDGFFPCCKTTGVHFMILGGINRIAWGTKLLLTAVWAPLIDCISLCHILKA